MHCSYILVILFLAIQISYAKVLEEVPEVTRQIHGSYGEFRDFTLADCNESYEKVYRSRYMQCSSKYPVFIYYWNNKLKGCERVIYRGCDATRNNFLTERDCNNQAKPICL